MKKNIANYIFCKVCSENKTRENFFSVNGNRKYPPCKSCRRKSQNKRDRTETGLIKKIYRSQNSSSKSRNHKLPTYDFDWFYAWIISATSFKEFFNKWTKSNFDTKFIPSVDRIDNSLGYTKENIQLMTFYDNKRKSNMLNEKLHLGEKSQKEVFCIFQENFK